MIGQKDTILYVTSRRSNVDTHLCQRILHASYSFLWARTVFDAIHKASYHDVKLVLIDNQLYGMRPTEVARTLKQYYPEISVIVLTSFEDYSPDLIKLDEGALFFLKPYNSEEVVKAIRYLTRRRNLNIYTNFQVPVIRQSHGLN